VNAEGGGLLNFYLILMSKITVSAIEAKQLINGYLARFIHTDNMTFSYVDVEKGKTLPEHSHHNEQVSIMLEGEFELTLEETPIRFGPGEVIVIPANAKHSGLAVTDCRILDVFYPAREDYRKLGGLSVK
jgi:quercetin dioxygenase-like cupin family protein